MRQYIVDGRLPVAGVPVAGGLATLRSRSTGRSTDARLILSRGGRHDEHQEDEHPGEQLRRPTARRTRRPRSGADRRCDAWGSCDCWCTMKRSYGGKVKPATPMSEDQSCNSLSTRETRDRGHPAPGRPRPRGEPMYQGGPDEHLPDRPSAWGLGRGPAGSRCEATPAGPLPGEQERATTPPWRSPAALTPPESFLRETVATRGVELQHLLARDDAAAVRPGLPRVVEGRHELRVRRRRRSCSSVRSASMS